MLRSLFFLVTLFVSFLGAEEESFPRPQGPLIILDAGHGGKDTGTKERSFMEKKLTLRTALLTKKRLQLLGYRVLLTRSRDADLSLERRVLLANERQGALFVSIHFNSAPNEVARGVEVFVPYKGEEARLRASRRLGDYILFHVTSETAAHSRGVKKGNFHVIRETEMPAVLVEGGFMSNRDERKLLRTKEYLEKIADGIAAGIDQYFRQ